jgi:septal ring factor EnvC (AmiA/AmiB activator)
LLPTRSIPAPIRPEERLLQILAKIDARLDDQDKVLKEIMAEQSRLRGLITQQDEAARTLAADGHAWADAALARYREAQLTEPQSPAPARESTRQVGDPAGLTSSACRSPASAISALITSRSSSNRIPY